MVAFKNNEKNKELEIQYREGNKKVYVSKGYSQIPLAEAMDFMKVQQKILKQQLISQKVDLEHYFSCLLKNTTWFHFMVLKLFVRIN